MENKSVEILSLFDLRRNDIFSAPTNSIVVLDEDDYPCGKIFFKDEHFCVRFGDQPKPYRDDDDYEGF